MSTVEARKSSFTPIVILCLIIVYIVWGSTYLAIKYTLPTMPPLLQTGTRFLVAGVVLMAFLAIRSHRWATPRQWLNCAIIGALMQGGCVGGIAIAEGTLSSGLASVGIATVPVWVVLFSGLYTKKWPTRLEIFGIAFGILGVVALNIQGGLSEASTGAVIIVVAALCWSLGSVISQHVDLPVGPMAYASEMVAGGAIVSVVGLAVGERVTETPDAAAIWSWVYLVVAGSLLAYSAYMYLLRNVRNAVATSYTLVTPVVAVLLGYWLLEENISLFTVLAVLAVLGGVWFIFRAKRVADHPQDEPESVERTS